MISVIIPAFNAERTIGRCLEALTRQSLPGEDYEVIVVDDGSTDRTRLIVERYAGVCLLTQERRGPAAARNAGATQARGDILLFTDADCEPTVDWLERMSAPFCSEAIAGVKGAYQTRQRGMIPRFVQIEYEDKYDRMARDEYIDFIDTYSAAYRRAVFLENGGFDTLFPTASVEDQEFSFRLARLGHKMVFVPEAIVYHHHVDSIKGYFQKKFRIGYWKALVHRRHPQKMFKDSHTPQSLKIQILLLPLLGAAILGALWWSPLWGAVAVMLGAFLGSVLRFTVKAWGKDMAVGLVSPFVLLLRAIALGLGFGVGVIRFWLIERGRAPHSGVLGSSPDPHFPFPEESPDGIPLISIRGPASNPWNRLGKRVLDLVGATLVLIGSAPLMLGLAIAIKLDSDGPVFFAQERIGKNGKPFKMYKFRTMTVGADKKVRELIDLGELEQATFKVKDDPRVTRVGRFVRHTSLDELPQLFNVLKGEMSLVGPRPEERWIVEMYSPWHRQRLMMKPGITGPMQISGRGDLPLDERVKLELAYIKHYSLLTDVKILLKTVPAVVSGKGAY